MHRPPIDGDAQVEGAKFSEEDIKALTHRIQFGGDEVVQAKDGAGSATLSMVRAENGKYLGVKYTLTPVTKQLGR